MAGIFDKLGGLLQSPIGQGVLGAAATGFNPLVGLLAGATQIPERKRLEEELAEKRKRIEALDQFEDLTTQTRFQQVPSLDLLSLDGTDMGQVDYRGRIGPDGQPVTGFREVNALQTPEGRAEAMGLLTRANPNAGPTIAGLLGEGRDSSAEKKVELLRRFGATDEEIRQALIGGRGGGIDEITARLKLLELENLQREKGEDTRESGMEFARQRTQLVSGATNIFDLYENAKTLAPYGIFGNPTVNEATLAGARFLPGGALDLGSGVALDRSIDKGQLADIRTAYGNFSRNANNIVTDMAQTLTSVGNSNAGRDLLAAGKPNLETSPQSTMDAIYHLAKVNLSNDEIMPDELKLPDSEKRKLQTIVNEVEERRQAIRDARDWLAQGGDPDKMREELFKMGIAPSEVGL